MKSLKSIANFLFESGILAKTPRSGFHFLGSGEQSVAEHLNRTSYIAYALAKLDGNVNTEKILEMAMFHDFAEGRVSDLNYVHQKYTERFEDKAIKDLADTLPFGEDILNLLEEYEKRESKESLFVKDADTLEWILSLKEQVDAGNTRAEEWTDSAVKRLKTDVAKELVQEILKTDSNEWWFHDKDDEWWVNRGQDTIYK